MVEIKPIEEHHIEQAKQAVLIVSLEIGQKMTQILFNFARKARYLKVRLELANPESQLQAMRFYRKLGFYPIERYNNSPCKIFMEKTL